MSLERTTVRNGLRCGNRCKPSALPPSFTIESVRTHPTYRYCLEPGAQCEHDDGHDGPHRAGGLIWHDPELLTVGG